MYIFRPQDYWGGSVDYMPWKLGEEVEYRPTANGGEHRAVSVPRRASEQTGVRSSYTDKGHGHGEIYELYAGAARRAPENAIAPARPRSTCRVESLGVIEGWGASDQFGIGADETTCPSDDGIASSVRGASPSRRKPSEVMKLYGYGESEVEKVLHGVLDALRRVRAVRESLR